MKTLMIRLAAPLQSYGNEATFNLRTSYPYPSKSAVIGMITAALGYRRGETGKIRILNKLKFATRVEQSGTLLNEFQTVEYAKSAFKTARKLTYRHFWQDAVFVVAIGSENGQQIDKICYALKHPKFQLYLGRRSNPPAGPLKIEVFNDQDPVSVLENLEWQASDWFKKKFKHEFFKTIIAADASLLPNSTSSTIKDNVGSFDQKNRYHNYRLVGEKIIELPNPEYKSETQSDFDIWKFV